MNETHTTPFSETNRSQLHSIQPKPINSFIANQPNWAQITQLHNPTQPNPTNSTNQAH